MPPSAASPSASSASSPLTPPGHGMPASAFPPLLPADLPAVLADPNALILDLRPFNAYSTARLRGALSLSVPSTLLKRPTYALARLAPMLSSTSARARFATWRDSSRIVVHDADAVGLLERPALLGLLRKFRAEGFDERHQVAWIKGGFNAVWRDRPDLIDHTPLPDEGEEEDEVTELAPPPLGLPTNIGPSASGLPGTLPEMAKSSSAPATTPSFPAQNMKALRTKALPMSAFTSASTLAVPRAFRAPLAPASTEGTAIPPTPAVGSSKQDPLAARGGAIPPTPGPSLLAARASKSLNPTNPQAAPSSAFNLRLPSFTSAPGTTLQPQSTVASQNLHPFPPVAGASSMPTLSASPGAYPATVSGMRPHRYSVPHGKPVAFNPFFDAIRQNLELAHGTETNGEGGRGSGIALRLPRRVRRRVGDLPFDWLREIARRSGRAKESSSDSESEADDEVVRNTAANARPAFSHASSASSSSSKRHHTSRHPPHPKLVPADPRSTTPPMSPPSSPPIRSPPQSRPQHYRSHSKTYPAPNETRPAPQGVPIKPKPLGDGPGDSADEDATSFSSHSPPSADDLTRALELQFYRIELGEQRRLMGVMEHHSLESQASVVGTGAVSVSSAGVVPVGGPEPKDEKENEKEEDFPFSITAGLEKGNKNRYRHIWPFEHARVRLRKARPDDDDYMNASYVQPLGTTKRYIATQGPLAATYADFWTLCWEQNVHVVVMLTREIEGNAVKCGKYWAEGEYGPLRLKLLATDDTPERERRRRDNEMNGGFFSAHVPPPQKSKRKSKKRGKLDDSDSEREIVRRVFKLTHVGYPQAKPRIITQLQYLDWPDFNVPEDPRGLLGLIREVEEAVARSREAGDRPWGEGPIHPGPWPARISLPTPSPPREHQPAVPSTIVEDVPMDDNEVDPFTGIARHAIGNPPVLLHCSAGVGRTGGYIAVDAVLDGIRREIRKRRETKSGSPDRMDVDPSPSPPSSGERAESRSRAPSGSPSVPELTMPVAVGADEVHVRVAGFTESMDVDSEAKRDGTIGKGKSARKEVPRTIVPASPELVDEVRRATMLRLPSGSTASTAGEAAPVSGKDWESSSSDSSPIPSRSVTRSTTLSGDSTSQTRSYQSTEATSPPSSHAGSSTSLSAVMAKQTAHMSLSQKEQSAAPVAKGSTSTEKHHPEDHSRRSQRRSEAEAHASRLDTWRSEVRPSSPPQGRSSKSPESTAATGAQTDEEGTVQGEGSQYGHPRVYDYAQPRPLHQDLSPPLLSSYNEPIRRVIEDMREQRMSLCQSLRQYVFVYRAVIEGALVIVDEEREREKRGRSSPNAAHGSKGITASSSERPDVDMDGLIGSPAEYPHSSSSGVSAVLRERDISRKRSISDYMREDAAIDSAHLTMSPGRTKRGASPTELPKEDVQGEAMLTKRPSIKRTARMDAA